MEEEKEEQIINKENITAHPAHLQVCSIIDGKDPSWQSIIYELVASEQLDPWNIDITILCGSYFGKIKELEEHNFNVSSKILLAASLLLRMKSEILLHKYIREIDNILFRKEDEDIQKIIDRIEIDEDEVPILSPKTPMPRFKKVTLQELIDALDVAIKTESRRIDKEIQKKQGERLAYIDIPKFKRINIKDRIRHFYARVLASFNNKKTEIKLPYSHFTGNVKEEKIACFLPMLYLSNHGKLWLEQEKHYAEIYVYLYGIFKKHFPNYEEGIIDLNSANEEITRELKEELVDEFKNAMTQAEDESHASIDEDEKQKRLEKINKDFENPIGDALDVVVSESE